MFEKNQVKFHSDNSLNLINVPSIEVRDNQMAHTVSQPMVKVEYIEDEDTLSDSCSESDFVEDDVE